MKEIVKKYTNGEVTVVWQPSKCIHSTNCFRGLPEVFDPNKRPWVNIQGANTDRVISQVKDCPSGALSFFMNGEESHQPEQHQTIIEVLANGPLIVQGTVKVRHKDGTESVAENKTAFCRCGGSENKPFCDGAHQKNGFIDE